MDEGAELVLAGLFDRTNALRLNEDLIRQGLAAQDPPGCAVVLGFLLKDRAAFFEGRVVLFERVFHLFSSVQWSSKLQEFQANAPSTVAANCSI